MFNSTTAKTPAGTECPGTINDSPSEVCWSWAGGNSYPLLAASAWDGSVTVWEIQTNRPLVNTPTPGLDPADGMNDPAPTSLVAVGKNQVNLGSPALCCRFVNAQTVIAGTLDKRVMMIKLPTNELAQIGRHEAWVKRVFLDERNQTVCSVSYDGTIKWWNGQANATAPIHNIPFQGKLVDADISKDILVIMTEDNKLTVYSLTNLTTPPKTFTIIPFGYPLTAVRLMPKGGGVCVCSVEGRARLISFLGKASDDFAFRCHRLDDRGEPLTTTNVGPEKQRAYAANAADFNPIYETLLTAGGDALIIIWDNHNRIKLHSGPKLPGPATCASYDVSGRLLAVGVGYDWQLGVVGKQQKQWPNKVLVLAVPDVWIKKKRAK